MVWGLKEPSSFGQFFPDGDYVGWREHLTEHFKEKMSDEEKAAADLKRPTSYIRYVTIRFRLETGVAVDGAPVLAPLEGHELPREFRAERPIKTLGSLILLTNRLLAVDAALKDIIETFEPGVHLFWPLRITQANGDDYPEAFYGMVIRQFRDSFVPDASAEGAWTGDGWTYRVSIPNKKNYTGLALSGDAIGGAHLWRDRALTDPDFFFSDDVQQAIAGAGLKIPKHYKLKVV
ncbi:imm11 family protein [Rhodovulum marinum]|uniref:Immunity MXAN-0049 protein domain-containing protein n=1 Tax=Rhodovulum marinum TaxID=320662 RepID=A0A4R2PMY5_9RHOB|nr:DUF1629 domain-containing protein [Rhodovulum marinum]TCP35415.1 hypothetical protein EV662_1294 [Rhodovulum marinum]